MKLSISWERTSMGPQVTVLDAAGLSSEFVVYIQSGETRQAVLEGLKVTGGGGGIFLLNSEPSIVGSWITENGGNFSGAGIWSFGQPYDRVPTFHPLIKDNTITHNTATRIGGGATERVSTWNRARFDLSTTISDCAGSLS
jgi:hypothetical protein